MKPKKALALSLVGIFAAISIAACAPETVPPEIVPPEYALSLEENSVLLAMPESCKSATLSAYVTCDGERDDTLIPTFTSGNPAVVTVNETGTLTAVSEGEAEITVSYTAGKTVLSQKASVQVLAQTTAEGVNSFEEEHVNLFGRTYMSGKKLVLDNVCTGIEVAFAGTKLECTFEASSFGSKVRIFVDGNEDGESVLLDSGTKKSTLCKDLTEGLHTVRVVKAASPQYNNLYLPENAFETDGTFLKAQKRPDLKIEFLGDSITAGAGAAGPAAQKDQTVANSDSTLTYAFLTASALNADFSIMAYEGICAKDGNSNMYANYLHYSFGNSTAYDPALFDADFVVIGLGENDMWHATSDQFPYTTEQFRTDYADLIRLVRQTRPNATIICVYGMMPAASTKQAKELIESAIADTGDTNIYSKQMKSNEQGACSHPNAKAHKTNADSLTKLIKELL